MKKYIILGIIIFLSLTLYCQNKTASFEYDNMNRLIKTIYSNCTEIAYSYDETGNRISTEITNSLPKPTANKFKYNLSYDDTVTLYANATFGEIVWFNNPYSESIIHTGNSFLIGPFVHDTIIYAAIKDGACISNKIQFNIAIDKEDAIYSDTVIWIGDTITLEAINNPKYRYHWSNGSTENQIKVSPFYPTQYTVTYYYGDGYEVSSQVNVFTMPKLFKIESSINEENNCGDSILLKSIPLPNITIEGDYFPDSWHPMYLQYIRWYITDTIDGSVVFEQPFGYKSFNFSEEIYLKPNTYKLTCEYLSGHDLITGAIFNIPALKIYNIELSNSSMFFTISDSLWLNDLNYHWLPSTNLSNSETHSTYAYSTNNTDYICNVESPTGGLSVSDTISIIIVPTPAGLISGETTVCPGQNSVVYSVPPIANATSYAWSLPSGATGTSTTNSITVDFGSSAISGDITVFGTNNCGSGTASTLAVTVNPLPDAAGIISGLEFVCLGQNSVVYTVPPIANATAYTWSLPSGATGTSATNSITVDFGYSPISGEITVYGINDCGNGTASTFAVTVNSLPDAAGIISGLEFVCLGQNSVVYTVTPIANATSYAWSLPSGASGTSTTNSITVDFGSSAISGDITVYGTNNCGSGTASTFTVTVNSLPDAAGIISGLEFVCQGQNPQFYYLPGINNATSYIWTLPSGATGTSTTNSINVDFGSSAISGYVTVKGSNYCGDGTASTFAVTVNPLPDAAGIISGLEFVNLGQNSVVYAVHPIANATSYAWSLPSGATGTSGTNSITVDFGSSAISGDITVYGMNDCGSGTASTFAVTVNPVPDAAGTISGLEFVCLGQNSVVYAVPPIANATSYAWSLPSGVTGTSSTNSITVDFGSSAISGDITVYGTNDYGSGTASTFAVTVNALPDAAGTITGNATVCQGQNFVTYTVPGIYNATSYVWTLPSGATGTSTTNSINVYFGSFAISGDITVYGTNDCGSGTASTFAVTVNSLPDAAGIISGLEFVCLGQNFVVYTVPPIANATAYAWSLPSGASGTSTTNSITVDFGSSAISGDITVYGTNDCGSGTASTFAVTVNSLPDAAGIISGLEFVCQGQNSVIYYVPGIYNATSYDWTLPSGATGTSTTNAIYVDFGSSSISGDVIVKGTNYCGDGTASTFAVTVNPLPDAAGIISGLEFVNLGQNSVVYTVPPIANATLYAWSLPNGATGSSSTNSITVDFGSSAISGDITVFGTNYCGYGTASTFAVTVNALPDTAGTITGNATVCQGQNSVTYSIPGIYNATSYVWTLPSGATGTSTTNIITVDFGSFAISGNITVYGTNDYGSGTASTFAVTVNSLPDAAGTITGNATVCQGQNSVTYTLPGIYNATSYVWTLPSGATGTSTTNSITVDYGTSAISGNISVYGMNDCGNGTASTLAITVNDKPVTPIISLNGYVLHSDAPLGNQWYDQNGFINGATSQNYTVSVNGDYYVIVTLLGCSSDPSNIIHVVLTGIETVDNSRTIKVYPNPVSNELIIEIDGNNERVNFEILNAIGQVVFKGNLVEKTMVQTSNFTSGVYLIKLENGETFEFKKIIKE